MKNSDDPEEILHKRHFIRINTVFYDKLDLQRISECQRATVSRVPAGRTRGSPVRSRIPTMRLRGTGGVSSLQRANQTTSRRGTPRLLGFIIPSASGGRPRLRLMPGAQDFIGPGRRIAAAPLSQLQRLGGRRSGVGRRRIGPTRSRQMTGIPGSVLRRPPAGTRVRGQTRGQIRQLPQNARNLISAARWSSQRTGDRTGIRSGVSGVRANRQPNIVFIRPPASNRAPGLTPDMVQRIRQTALRRAAAQRAATASGRTGMRGQPQSQIRTLNGRGVRPQSRAELAAAMRRRMNAQNNARRSGSVPRSQIGTTRQVVRPTEQIQTRNTMPTRVDEAVLRANIMPAGTGTGSDSVQNVVTTTTTSSETSSSSKSSSSSSNNVLTSGSSSSGVDILQTAAPLLNQGQPTDIQFRSAVDNAASNVPKAVDFSGIGTSLPALETGPAFQVAGNSGDTSLPMDIGVASGQGLGGNQLFDSIAAANALQDIGNTIPSVLPTEDPNLLAAGAFGPSFPQGNTGMGQSISIEPEIQLTNPMAGLEGPLTSMGTGLGMGTLNPDPTAIGATVTDPLNPNIAKPTTVDSANSLKSMIVDVLRDMAVKDRSSNSQPDISAMAQHVLQSQQNTDASLIKADTALANGQSTGINMNEPLFQQTFTLPPQPPTVFGHTNPMQTFLHGVPATASPLPDMFHGTRHDQTPLFTKSPATSATKSTSASQLPKHMPKLNDISPTFAGTLQTKRPTQISSKLNSVNNKDLLQGIPHTAGFTEPPVHILSSNHAVPLHTPSSITTTTISPPVAANDQLNIIVGDWTGADQHLSGPSKSPPLNVDQIHNHNHIHTHIHGVSEPAIPRPPPLSQDSLVSYEILPVTDSGKSLIMNSAEEKNGTNGNNMVKGMTDHIRTGSLENMMGLNLAEVNTGQTTQDAQLNSGPDFSANNLQTVNSGVPISVPAASSSSRSDISADNINTIAIENKLFDTNMPGGSEIIAVGASPSFPNTAVDQPIIDSALPIGEQIMRQLPVPNELVNALTGGINDNSQNMFSPDTMLQSDQRFSPNNVRDGLILDSMSASVQDIPNDNSRIDLLSAPSLDRLASSLPMGDILTAPQNMQNTIAANNNDPTIMKIANILPQADRNQGRGGSKAEMPSLSMDAKGFTTEGKFNTIQRGFNNPTRLSSKNGIDIQMNITPHFTSRTETNNNNIKTSQRTHTANIQTDGSFLGSASPVPQVGAGKGLSMWDSNDPMFYDQASLLGSISGTLTPSSKQQLAVDVPLPPPQIDTTAPAVTVTEDKPNSNITRDGIKDIGTTKPDNFQEPVSFTSAVDAPITTFVDPNIAPPTGSSSAGATQNEFGSIENNPNWAVFDPTAFTMDLNFADINPIITGIDEPASDVAFVNTNDIKFTNAFDVTPMKYEPTPSSPTSSPSTTPKAKSTPVVEATPVSKVASDVVNIKTPEKVNTQTITANKPLNDRGAKFEEVVIAPLPFSPSGTGQTSVELPPPPPIFK